MARRHVPRLSAYYELYAEYFFLRDNEHSVWFYLMAAWFYEDEDEELGRQGDLFFVPETPEKVE